MSVDEILWLLAVISWGIEALSGLGIKTRVNFFALGFMFARITMLT